MEGKENERAVAATKKEEGDAAENPRLPKAVEWLPVLISSKHFFQPCAKCTQRPLTSSEIHKASVNYLCLNCADPRGVCQLCMQEHANHHILHPLPHLLGYHCQVPWRACIRQVRLRKQLEHLIS